MKKLLPRGVLAYAMHILHTIYFLLGGYQYGHKGWYYEAAEKKLWSWEQAIVLFVCSTAGIRHIEWKVDRQEALLDKGENDPLKP